MVQPRQVSNQPGYSGRAVPVVGGTGGGIYVEFTAEADAKTHRLSGTCRTRGQQIENQLIGNENEIGRQAGTINANSDVISESLRRFKPSKVADAFLSPALPRRSHWNVRPRHDASNDINKNTHGIW